MAQRTIVTLLLLVAGTIGISVPARAQTGVVDQDLQAGFHAMYALDFTESERRFQDYVRRRPDDALGPTAQATCVFFGELNRLHALDAEFFVDDKKLLSETKGTPDGDAKKRMLEFTAQGRKIAEEVLAHDSTNQNAIFALAFINGLEADYSFLIEKERLAAAKPGRMGYDYAKRLIEVNPAFYDAYIWTGVTNYVVASLPWPVRWLAKLRGYPGSKETAVADLRLAADKGGLLRPYARVLLTVTYLRANRKSEAQALLLELSSEFPANPLFAKHARRLSESARTK